MKNKLMFLTKLSLNKKIKSKWFIIVNIIICVFIVGLVNIDNIIKFFGGDFNNETKFIVIDNVGVYDDLSFKYNEAKNVVDGLSNSSMNLFTNTVEEATNLVENEDNILLIINESKDNFFEIEMIVNNTIDSLLYQSLVSSINSTKENYALKQYNISDEMLSSIEKPVLIEKTRLDENKSVDETLNLVISTVFPVVILPFFMLTMFLVQMIGGEINEEKTTKSMEIIIANVSPRTHFLSKMFSSNIFVIFQGFLLFCYSMIAVAIRFFTSSSVSAINNSLSTSITDYTSGIIAQLNYSGIIDRLIYIVPLTIILMILTFVLYSLLAGILASMTTSIDDYNQVQTPVIIISVIGYYLSTLSAVFEGALFIKVLAYIPLLSAMLAPSLLIAGQITIFDVIISIVILVVVIYLLFKYGLKVYKVGILNYSSTNIWKKLFKAVKH
ncbi:MAG: ABC transporter permease [bacterium]|nr:ABC transporter permease [bacterium]